MKKETNSGMGIIGVIFMIFLILKLSGVGSVANWSWWWVTSPLWISFCIGFIIEFTKAIKIFKK